jgi:hypothetical protein
VTPQLRIPDQRACGSVEGVARYCGSAGDRRAGGTTRRSASLTEEGRRMAARTFSKSSSLGCRVAWSQAVGVKKGLFLRAFFHSTEKRALAMLTIQAQSVRLIPAELADYAACSLRDDAKKGGPARAAGARADGGCGSTAVACRTSDHPAALGLGVQGRSSINTAIFWALWHSRGPFSYCHI